MIEVYIYENETLLESLEDTLLEGERQHSLNDEQINEIFRIMHTIKGSSAMMNFDSLSKLSHAVEDLFAQIREKKARSSDWDKIFDIVLQAADMLKAGVASISAGQIPDANAPEHTALVKVIHDYLELLSHRKIEPKDEGLELPEPEADEDFDDSNALFYKIKIIFEPDCQMENLRAFGVVTDMGNHSHKLAHIPDNLMEDGISEEIVKNGFLLYMQSSENPDDLQKLLNSTLFLQQATIIPLPEDSEELPEKLRPKKPEEAPVADDPQAPAKAAPSESISKQNFISINVNKLDKLLDLVGEIVTTESMVTKNPEVVALSLESFERSGTQLRKLINELQDIVMSVRMVPVSGTFHKMNRIVRDMSKKIGKEIDLVIIGEETEVDKNIIDNLSDPLMHLIRNAVDHGIEPAEVRAAKGKPTKGTVTLEARNTGGDVMIFVNDDGKGLDRSVLIKKAIDKGLTTKTEAEFTDKEAFALMFAPGLSTKEAVTEFSGRGVGMDVVRRNIEKVGGTVSIESAIDAGTSIQIRIPLTLAIIEGMKLQVGNLGFIVPMLSIQESFKPNLEDVFLDPDGNEMIMIRGEVYPIVRLHQIFDIQPDVEDLADGILIMIATENSAYCLFVDQLIGEQQAVVKPLPSYLQRHNTNMHGIAGCTILGDGSISLIVEINSLVSTLK